jgi:serine/threonine protein kinase/Tol biopolymer transport system component
MSLERGSVLINRYRIVEILGQGGMGSIYRAVDENLGVEVAVKENLFTSEEYARQFRREAVILANLRHPNLPRVTDHFVIDGQGQYLVMDFIEGEDLRERIDREGLLSDADAVILGVAISEALSYLHTQQPQIVHRDIKPGNVKITSSGNVVLVDFGLAKFTQGSQVTTTGARAMTPGYSPPEQYGTARTDHRTDIYSLGATLYMSLTGELPEDALARAMGQADLTPIRTLNPKVSRRLANVIERAMELRPDDRYQSAEDLKKALLDSRVITGRKGKQEATLSPAPAVAAGEEAEVDRVSHPGSPLIPAATSGTEMKSRKIFRPRTGCWLIGIFFIISLVVIIAGAYLFQPELVDQAVSWIPNNVYPIPLPAWLIPPTQTFTPAVSPLVQDSLTEVSGMVSSTTPPPFSPTADIKATTATNTTTVEPTTPPQPTATFTPSPTPLGGGEGQIAFASDVTGLPQIWLMNSDGTASRQITEMPEGACQPAWSPDGERLAFISPCAGNQETYPGAAIFIINVDGTDLVSLPSMPGGDFDPRWSPDGSEIAFTSLRDYNRAQVYKIKLADNSIVSLSANTVRDSQPAWSPDGKEIAFVTTRRGPYQIWIMLEDGAETTLLSRSGSLKNTHPVWSPDGQVIMYTQTALLGGVPRLVAMRVEEGNLIESRVIREIIPMQEASYSPDGTWIAFESWPEGSSHDIFIMTPNGLGRQRLTDDEAFDFDPAWRP